MDRLASMSVLLAVVTAGSFSGASRALRMPLPTVSRKVSELESHLKAKLIIRSTRKLALTEAGQAYVAACRRILEDVAETERRTAGEYSAVRGELSITAPLVFGRLHVAPVVAEFLIAHPEVDVHLTLTDRGLDLIDDRLDLAVRIGTPPDSRLIAVRVGQARRVICASPGYLKRRGVPEVPEALAGHDCVSFAGLGEAGLWMFPGNKAVRVRSRLVVNTAEAAIDAAVASVGITRVLSYQVAHAVKSKALAIALKQFEPAPAPVNLIYRQETLLTAKLRAFLDFATPRLHMRLSSAAC